MADRPQPSPKSKATSARARPDNRILGPHPALPNPFAEITLAQDGHTQSKVEHRALVERNGVRTTTVSTLREMLTRHHTSCEALERSRRHREAINRLGFQIEQANFHRFPTSDTTRKGNLAEVILAEYVVGTENITLPVYRLRYNPNVNQSMKGDDVLAFDFSTTPVRVVIGEAKYRATSSVAAVKEIVEGLARSHAGGIPVSLQFVADRLFEDEQPELGERVLECGKLFALDKLRLDYVGMLVSDTDCSTRVNTSTPTPQQRLAMISLALEDLEILVGLCYDHLE